MSELYELIADLWVGDSFEGLDGVRPMLYTAEDVSALVEANKQMADTFEAFMRVTMASPTPAIMALAADANEARKLARKAAEPFPPRQPERNE